MQPFFINTGRDEAEKFKLGEFMLSLQPDTYVMHGIENAAGYDGFGLTRYSKLTDDMKLWGELTDPGRSVRWSRPRVRHPQRALPSEAEPAGRGTATGGRTLAGGGRRSAGR